MSGPDHMRPAKIGSRHIVHGTCVAICGRGVLIIGASGTGKSALALALLSLGAGLVSDDRVILSRNGDVVCAAAPTAIAGLIEARGVGLLNATPVGPATVDLVVDMDQTEVSRLPERRELAILGRSVTLLRKVDAPHFSHAIMQYLKAGRQDI